MSGLRFRFGFEIEALFFELKYLNVVPDKVSVGVAIRKYLFIESSDEWMNELESKSAISTLRKGDTRHDSHHCR
jgi:hypothetical protein